MHSMLMWSSTSEIIRSDELFYCITGFSNIFLIKVTHLVERERAIVRERERFKLTLKDRGCFSLAPVFLIGSCSKLNFLLVWCNFHDQHR